MFIRDDGYIYGGRLVDRISCGTGGSHWLVLPKRCYYMLGINRVLDKNRSKIEIIAEILRQLRVPTVRTNIMSHCNMSSAQSGQYLTFMRSSELIRMDAIRGMITYQRTEAGREFLGLYNKMVLLLDPSISEPSLF